MLLFSKPCNVSLRSSINTYVHFRPITKLVTRTLPVFGMPRNCNWLVLRRSIGNSVLKRWIFLVSIEKIKKNQVSITKGHDFYRNNAQVNTQVDDSEWKRFKPEQNLLRLEWFGTHGYGVSNIHISIEKNLKHMWPYVTY